MMRGLAALAFGICATAAAADPQQKPLPSLALDPLPAMSPWHGTWVATDLVVVGSRGKGFVGGSVSGGYDHAFADGTRLGLRAATGVAPGWAGFGGVRPYDFASVGASLAYPMGRWTPYLSTALVLAKPLDRPQSGFAALDTANDLFNGAGRTDVGGTLGTGVSYALTPDTSVGVGIAVHRGSASVFP